MKSRSVLLALAFCGAVAVAAGAQAFNPATVGPPWSNAPAELYVPAGTVPTAAVVVLHGCDGVKPHYRLWVQRLVAWGYAALLIDSFRPRGFTEVCNHGLLVPPGRRRAMLSTVPRICAPLPSSAYNGWA